MSSFVVKNNAESTVADNPLAQAAVTLNVAGGEGANFPSTFPFLITIWDDDTYPDPSDDSGMEIVKCTARSTDALTIVRGEEGTGDVAHALAERVAMLITAGIFNDATYGVSTKLDGITAGATKYPDTGEQAFLDADHTKLDGITASADVTADNTASSVVHTRTYLGVSDDLLNSNDAEKSTSSNTYVKVKETLFTGDSGTLRIKFGTSGDGCAFFPNARIYRNGGAVGTERQGSADDYPTFVTWSEDIAGWSDGDLLQVYAKDNGSPGTLYVNNLRVYGEYGAPVKEIGTNNELSFTNQDP